MGVGAVWHRADESLVAAREFFDKGTGDPLIEGSLLSITASLQADLGRYSEAEQTLAKCLALYEEIRKWPLVARTLVQWGNALAESEPARSLDYVARAIPLIPPAETLLAWQADIVQVECLIQLKRVEEALFVFGRCQARQEGHPQVKVRLRGTFTCARLLEALGRPREAERLFRHVIDEDFENGLYKDGLLDLLYWFGSCVRAGLLDRATEVCHRALREIAQLDFAHDQLSAVWSELLEATLERAVTSETVSVVRDYFRRHWRSPAPEAPRIMPKAG